MADDVKLTLGIDVEALQRSASQATNALVQSFEKNFGANLLGSGQAPTQGPQGMSGKDTLRGVVDALERIERTLIGGFTALSGGVYAGGGGGGGAGMGGGGGSPSLAPNTPGTGIAGGPLGIAGQAISRAGDLAAALMPSSMKMFMGGFYSTDVMGFVHNLVSQIPVAGKLLGAITGPFHQVMQQNDEFKNIQYELFRDVGADYMDAFTNAWSKPWGEMTSDDHYRNLIRRFGLSRSESAGLANAAGQFGADYEPILQMQGMFGLGTQGAQLSGAMRQSGVKMDDVDKFANVLGIAVSTGLERGRWGELVQWATRAAQTAVQTGLDLQRTQAVAQFIAGGGQRFAVGSPGFSAAESALQRMITDQQSPFALMAAMQQTGGDFAQAQSMLEKGFEVGGLDPDRVLDMVWNLGPTQRWAATATQDNPRGDEKLLAQASFMAKLVNPKLTQSEIENLLVMRNRSRVGVGLRAGQAEKAKDLLVRGEMPNVALGPRQSAADAARPSDLTAIQEADTVQNAQARAAQGQTEESERQRLMQEVSAGRAKIIFFPGTADATDQPQQQRPIAAPGQGPVSAAPAGGITGGVGELSAADIQSAAALAGIPAETMRSWFQIESGGHLAPDAGDYSHGQLAARGFGRLSQGEAAMVGVGGPEFARLSTDKAFSLQKSAELAKRYMERARAQAPADWSEDDILHLMKLQHGGVGTAQFIMQDYQRRFGKMPRSWDELFQGEKGVLPGGPGVGQLGALLNANKIEVTVHVDQTGRVAGTRVRTAGPNVVTAPGQINTAAGGYR